MKKQTKKNLLGKYYTVRRTVSNFYYYWKCKLFHPYNVVKVKSLPPTWVDRDNLLFHASFQILQDFVEREKPFEWFDTVNSAHAKQWTELKELYNWWIVYKDQTQYSENFEIENIKLRKLIDLRKLLWT